ncbi:DUF2807 domain-containing protein [Cellulophaga sp. E16_2]|uniref:GIN domain-containing protein n=1 Tax=Cellulophaga sp. E16_2 TaxID=2789297 RepID=UPI001A90EF12|nr:DUF2807 domain-containing protein [Cellulophaga sp. E16_2]MBO0592469.1 DUF2807 domain-containing protein [Cellulophaga sp. E16_2]
MKKNIITITLLFISAFMWAQKKDKLAGNKVLVDVIKTLDGFNKLEISDNLNVNISQTLENGYHLRTDENLVETIRFAIIDSVLKIYTLHNITKSKKLEINLSFINLENISISQDVKLKSMNRLNSKDLNFISNDNSTYDLDLSIENATFIFNKHAKGKLRLKGDTIKMVLNDNTNLEGDIVSDALDVTVNDKSDIELTGDVTNLKLVATGSSDIQAKKLKTTYANLNGSNTADIYINTTKELELYMQGKSDVYVYGSPEIKVAGMNDNSKIIKK